jgi:sulfate permease, SulP family
VAGSAGVVAIPLAALHANYGAAYVSACLLLVGAMQILFGVLKQGYLMKFATEPVIAGFLNAFAYFLYNSQLKAFRVPSAQIPGSLGLAGLTAACIQLGATGLTKGVPGSLVGLVLSSVIAYVFSLDVKTLADVAGPGVFSGGLKTLPIFTLPANLLDSTVFLIVLQPALGILIITVIETVLASKIVSPDKTESDLLCVGLGVGNGLSAITGGIGGCGLIPNTG